MFSSMLFLKNSAVNFNADLVRINMDMFGNVICLEFSSKILTQNCGILRKDMSFFSNTMIGNIIHYLIIILINKLTIIWASTGETLASGCANNKDAGQPAHLPRLIRAFVIHCWKNHIETCYKLNFIFSSLSL